MIHFTPAEPRPEAKAEHCPDHPNAPSEPGFGLAGGGFGPYDVCSECGRVFNKQVMGWEDD